MDTQLDSFARGQVCSGVVSQTEPFGVFVELPGGVEGFVAVPELSWRPLGSVGDVVRVGQKVQAVVLDIDIERSQVRLSLRATQEDPFRQLEALVGQAVTGPVTKIAPIGVFVRIEDRPDGFEGLLPHAGVGGGTSDEEPAAVAAEGERIKVIIASVDLHHRRIRLSPVDAQRNPADLR